MVMERNLPEVSLKDLECDWVETGAAHETQRELEARLRKAQKECAGRSWECLSRTSAAKRARSEGEAFADHSNQHWQFHSGERSHVISS